jgi:hypothetical protein
MEDYEKFLNKLRFKLNDYEEPVSRRMKEGKSYSLNEIPTNKKLTEKESQKLLDIINQKNFLVSKCGNCYDECEYLIVRFSELSPGAKETKRFLRISERQIEENYKNRLEKIFTSEDNQCLLDYYRI